MTVLKIQDPDHRAEAEKWIRSSLSEGLVISRAVASKMTAGVGAVYVVGDEQRVAGQTGGFSSGRGGSSAEADASVQRFVNVVPEVNLLLVEDDLARPTDPHLFGNAVFFGDAVVRWIDLPDAAPSASELLRRGASGYPLNAFLLRAQRAALGLSPGRKMTEDAVGVIANEVRAVIVAAFDAEAYLLWTADDLVVTGLW